ncbi:MAG: site-specific DNA-methyltransferase [Bacteroidetes bacterium HGW-Bacteroidetes-20]|nr:MAG: site-specific DNA-methyltransferase [Bacteroidetes bacterium HGW-Bacteroidetes-20]
MDGKSVTPEQEKLNALRQLLPEVFCEGKIDWEKLKANLGENINFSNERYVLNWAGKSEAFKVLQTPTTKTLIPAKEESVYFDNTENIFIEGENLEVLKVLQKSYFGKVKMIYIDPPYNTGNDSFIYPDKFSETKEEYQKRVGDKDDEGYMIKDGMFKKNSKENGQYHSNWLNMMMPRLYLAKNLLRQDGVIFVSIDDNEVHNLRLLMSEIFGEENFLAELIWERAYSPKNDAKYISNSHDYVLMYVKNISEFRIGRLNRTEEANSRYSNPDNDPRGVWKSSDMSVKTYSKSGDYTIETPTGRIINPPSGRCWGLSYESFMEKLKDNRISFGPNQDGMPRTKTFLSELKFEGMAPQSLLFYKDVGHSQEGRQELKKLFDDNGYFDGPKPIRLLNRLIQLANLENNSLILDFFAGSGTTAHAVMDLNKEDGENRKYICVQLPELCDEKSEAFKAGYKTIADISKERIRRAGIKIKQEAETDIKKIESDIQKLQGEIPTEETQTEIENLKIKMEQLKTQDFGFKVLKLEESNFKQWKQINNKDLNALEEQIKLFIDPVSETATVENMVYELLLKSGKDLNSSIEKNDGYFLINGNEMALILEKVSQELITEVMSKYPKKVIALDKLFKGNDQLKTNTVLQMKDAGIEFKTI